MGSLAEIASIAMDGELAEENLTRLVAEDWLENIVAGAVRGMGHRWSRGQWHWRWSRLMVQAIAGGGLCGGGGG